MSEWQPIKTAPKDGTWILAWGIDKSVQRVSWGRTRQGELQWCTPHGWCAFRYLTHWMPLPDPPKAAGLLGDPEGPQLQEKQDDQSRVDGFPGGAHGDLPHPPTE